MSTPSEHWEAVWAERDTESVSWFEADPVTSYDMISAAVGPDVAVIDVGGGASLLVDRLLEAGFVDLTVLDVSAAALTRARDRLGAAASAVTWRVADVTEARMERSYDLWHDRAVLHFLTDDADRHRYVDVLREALSDGGHAVIATFGPQGPTSCSGLPVLRYDAAALASLLGERFELVDSRIHEHHTPTQALQQFQYTRFVTRGS